VTLEKDSVWAITRALVIRAKQAAATQADCHDLVGIATAFSTDAEVQYNVCNAMVTIAVYGKAEGAHKLLAAGGHRVAVAALHACSTNVGVLARAFWVLYHIAAHGGADAKAAIRAVDGTLIEKLRQACDVVTAAGLWDEVTAACALAQLV
jgi:hypothetical protein